MKLREFLAVAVCDIELLPLIVGSAYTTPGRQPLKNVPSQR